MKSEDLLGTHSNLKEFLPFLDRLNNESDRGKVLIASGFLEEQLKQVLLAFMRESATDLGLFEGGNAPLGSLSSRIAASYGLGLITEDEHYDMTLIRKIRNDFAHNVHTTFEKPSIADRCKELRSRAQDYGSDREKCDRDDAGWSIHNCCSRYHSAARESATLCREGKAVGEEMAVLESNSQTESIKV